MGRLGVFIVIALMAVVCMPHVRGEDAAPQSVQAETPQGERFGFQAEVKRLMKILVNSLYSNKDISIRELISNGSDALDKIRFLALTNSTLLGEGEEAKLEIKIKADPAAGTLTFRDRGVGMTKEELIKNLGTIAQSGTVEFLNKHKSVAGSSAEPEEGGKASSDLIGQFGVGFYSSFLIADRVTVRSKSNDDADAWLWESDAGGEFTVRKDESSEPLARGTEITLHLKEAERARYTDIEVMRDIIRKYSEFINFPIYLWASHEEDVPAPAEPEIKTEDDEEETLGPKDEEEKEGEEAEKEDEADDDLEVEKAEEAPKTVKQTVWSWEVLNSVKPIWMRAPKKITEEEYEAFYKTITKDTVAPLTRVHFTAEGDTEFRALLYVPTQAPSNVLDATPHAHENNIRMYVRRVFVTGTYEVMPAYLRFIKGVVDSDDIPLNVGREHLQESKLLMAVRSKLVRKTIGMFQEMFKNDTTRTGKYKEFWGQYANNIKFGIMEDKHNRERLSKLLLYHTTQFPDGNLTSLEEYISRMKEGQSGIYFLAGESYEQIRASPLLERLARLGYEVLLMGDSADEWVAQNLEKYAGKELINIARDGAKITAEDDKEAKAAEERLSKLLPWMQDKLVKFGVYKVVASTRLTMTPAAVVSPQWGMTANMQRVMRAHSLPGAKTMGAMADKIVELNPDHPVIQELLRLVEEDKADAATESAARTLYFSALVGSGFPIDKVTADMSTEINAMLAHSLGVSPHVKDADAPAPEVEKAADTPAPEEKKEEHVEP